MSKSGQKFVARNRAPRVQIEYDVEVYGAEKTVQLPFVMGVMADLSGTSAEPLPAVGDRKFLEIDIDNFDERMKAMRPRAAFHVPNMLTGESNLSVDLTFESMEDFSPAAIAKKVEPLRKLLEARTKLSHLVTYMDGKTGAEDLIARLISDPAVLAALTGAQGAAEVSTDDRFRAIESLRAATPEPAPVPGGQDVDAILNSLRGVPVAQAPDHGASAAEVLDRMRLSAPTEAVDVAEQNDGLGSAAADDLDAFSRVGDDDDLDTAGDLQQLPEFFFDHPDDEAEVELSLNEAPETEASDRLEAHLHGMEPDEADEPGHSTVSDMDADDDLSALLASFDDDEAMAEVADKAAPDADAHATALQAPFGILTVERPAELDLPRQKFRIALLGDFSGRAARGITEIGDALARAKPIRFDVDSIEAVIARFATTLVLPVGQDGSGVEVTLKGLDDLHPDALYDNVAVFQELFALRQRVARGDPKAIAELQTWAGIHGDFDASSRKRAGGSMVPADRKLSDFHSLIGDRQARLVKPSPASVLIARIVGPYVHVASDPAQDKMLAAIDEALSGAMRTILHHPDFQAVEATWRSLELLARRVETGAGLEIVLYDVSAEEWAADLSAQDDLAESGLFRMLAEEPRLDERQGPLSAVFALYSLEETPPHAELLARMSKISAWMTASFVAAISPQFLETRKQDRHPIVAKAWDALRALPEAAYVGLVAPRFLLRLPYGQRTEPVDPFDFEEFSLRSGLKGMLWANPVILSAILMAATVTRTGKALRLGEVMSLGDVPVHVITDPHGDQVALPCTERLLDSRTTAEVVARGFMPVVSIKGRNEVRQASFQSLAGVVLAGPWAEAPARATGGDTSTVGFGGRPDAQPKTVSDDTAVPGGDVGTTAAEASDDDISLDDLLAQFTNDADATPEPELDPELAALLESL
jgi:type VI secretion system ImpB/VipA family protein